MSRNVLLTTMSTSNATGINYYYFFDKNNNDNVYCIGKYQQEPGVKFALYQDKIDEIVAIASDDIIARNPQMPLGCSITLDKDSRTNDDNNEYSLLINGIIQFFSGKNSEFDHILSCIDDDFRQEVEGKIREFNSQSKYEIKTFQNVFDCVYKNKPIDEKNNAKAILYNALVQNSQMYLKSKCDKVNLCVVRARTNNHNDNIQEIIDAVKRGASEVNLYIDMQGGNRTDGYIRQAVISILNNEFGKNVNTKMIYAIDFKPSNAFNEIVDESERYGINNLVAGMNAFIQYGKADLIQRYVDNNTNLKDNALVEAMVDVDEALSFCNTGKLKTAIEKIRRYYNTSAGQTETAFSVLEEGIRRDYGKLLEGESLDVIELIDWCVRKKFYQQALTIIESMMPEEMYKYGIFMFADADYEDAEKIKAKSTKGYLSTEHFLFDTYIYSLSNGISEAERKQIKNQYHKATGEKDGDYNKRITDLSHRRCLSLLLQGKSIYAKSFSNGSKAEYSEANKKKNTNNVYSFDISTLACDKKELLGQYLVLHKVLKNIRNMINHAVDKERPQKNEIEYAVKKYVEYSRELFAYGDLEKSKQIRKTSPKSFTIIEKNNGIIIKEKKTANQCNPKLLSKDGELYFNVSSINENTGTMLGRINEVEAYLPKVYSKGLPRKGIKFDEGFRVKIKEAEFDNSQGKYRVTPLDEDRFKDEYRTFAEKQIIKDNI